ncbi:UDP-glucuronosyltransferase 2A3-like [Ptychodera flava]|uniref:UDP-glucuronosyltransferase 2A3-like n=1 Tax=Ptychodera flava TaxID=63121 RepID=UPI003969CE4E
MWEAAWKKLFTKLKTVSVGKCVPSDRSTLDVEPHPMIKGLCLAKADSIRLRKVTLTGHPKTKAFVAHGGMNSVYEAIYHGIPVVGVPLLGDHSDNFARLVDRGMALTVDIVTLTEEQLYKAVTTVVHDKSFKENAMRLSRIHRNQPMTAGESVVYWTEYVLRHGGQHFRPASFDLNVFQYFLVDVIAFCLVVCGIVVYIAAKMCKLCCHVCRRKEKIQ